jgi:hypothetical protein
MTQSRDLFSEILIGSKKPDDGHEWPKHVFILILKNIHPFISYELCFWPPSHLSSVSDKSSPILFADDTSFITANRNETEFKFNINETFNEINKWFHSSLLMLNYKKTYLLQFLTKTDHEINMQVSFGNRKIATTQSLKFLGLTIDTSLTWKHCIGELNLDWLRLVMPSDQLSHLCP